MGLGYNMENTLKWMQLLLITRDIMLAAEVFFIQNMERNQVLSEIQILIFMHIFWLVEYKMFVINE